MSSHQPFNTHRPSSATNASPSHQMSSASSSSVSAGASGAPGSLSASHLSDVDHIPSLSSHIGALFLNDEYSDVSLVVDGQRFRAHRVILAARSEYFRALLYGGMKESQLSEIELMDTSLAAFKHLLRYIYTGQMRLGNLKDDLILEILGLAHQYGFEDLEAAISDYLRSILSIHNVCFIYDTASLYRLEHLVSSCCTFMDRHAGDVIKHESFNTLSASGIKEILLRDSFCAAEVAIFTAVHEWTRANHGTVAEDTAASILSSVRLSLMSTPDLLKVVRPTGLVPADVLLDAIQSRTESRDMELQYRGYLLPEENVAQPKHGAQVLFGEVKQALLDGDSKNYDMERGFSRHPIDEAQTDKGIVIRLGMQCIINHIKMLLWDRDQRAYSYYIDVSMDQEDWVRVCDHSKYYCRSWQELYFRPRVVKFIRIVGTHNTVNKVFHVVSLEASYTKKPFHLDANGIIIPKANVASISMSACVIEGVCRSRNALLNGDTSNYDWDSGYTCHQLGSGAIIVQLGQPYALSSMRLLLWDCDERSYSFYVEVSVNQRDWEVVCDRSRENCKSWQTIRFPRRPVVYIKIVGTHNTANEVFHCVHFECPAVTGETTSTLAGPEDSAAVATEEQPQKQHHPGPFNVQRSPSRESGASAASASSSSSSSFSTGKSSSLVVSAANPDAVVAGGGGLANAVDANVDDRASHQSSPASYAGSGSIPVGASATSMARRGQWPGTNGVQSYAAAFNKRREQQCKLELKVERENFYSSRELDP